MAELGRCLVAERGAVRDEAAVTTTQRNHALALATTAAAARADSHRLLLAAPGIFSVAQSRRARARAIARMLTLLQPAMVELGKRLVSAPGASRIERNSVTSQPDHAATVAAAARAGSHRLKPVAPASSGFTPSVYERASAIARTFATQAATGGLGRRFVAEPDAAHSEGPSTSNTDYNPGMAALTVALPAHTVSASYSIPPQSEQIDSRRRSGGRSSTDHQRSVERGNPQPLKVEPIAPKLEPRRSRRRKAQERDAER